MSDSNSPFELICRALDPVEARIVAHLDGSEDPENPLTVEQLRAAFRDVRQLTRAQRERMANLLTMRFLGFRL